MAYKRGRKPIEETHAFRNSTLAEFVRKHATKLAKVTATFKRSISGPLKDGIMTVHATNRVVLSSLSESGDTHRSVNVSISDLESAKDDILRFLEPKAPIDDMVPCRTLHDAIKANFGKQGKARK